MDRQMQFFAAVQSYSKILVFETTKVGVDGEELPSD